MIVALVHNLKLKGMPRVETSHESLPLHHPPAEHHEGHALEGVNVLEGIAAQFHRPSVASNIQASGKWVTRNRRPVHCRESTSYRMAPS